MSLLVADEIAGASSLAGLLVAISEQFRAIVDGGRGFGGQQRSRQKPERPRVEKSLLRSAMLATTTAPNGKPCCKASPGARRERLAGIDQRQTEPIVETADELRPCRQVPWQTDHATTAHATDLRG